MSHSRVAQSGLGSLKRTFSDTESASQPKCARSLPFDMHAQPPPAKKSRLQLIQEALDAKNNGQLPPPRIVSAPKTQPSSQRSSKPSSSFEDALMQPTTFKKPASSAPPPPKPKPAKITLSDEQTKILGFVKNGESVFYTGSAGTGKSVLLREIIKTLRKVHSRFPDAVAITASTGIAACNIGGTTIHSFAGIGIGAGSAEDLSKRVMKSKKATSRWMRTKVLIIDEVSMLDGELFDKLSRVGTIVRKNSAPFGGIQVIVTGDFFQLPPVTKNKAVTFAFDAQLWSQTIKKSFNLTQVFRQRDSQFIDMLNEMRFGRLSQKSIKTFKSLSRPIEYDDGIGPTELFPLRNGVDASNNARMRSLGTDSVIFKAFEGGMVTDTEQRDRLLSNFMAPRELSLKVNAQVMLIKNMEEGILANGSMGRVLSFENPAKWSGAITTNSNDKNPTKPAAGDRWPVVEFAGPYGPITMMLQRETWKVELPGGEVQVSRTQFPIILAWAMSIHKSQGQTLDRVKVDLGQIFEKGQAYVALSRATSLEGLQILNFDEKKVKAHDRVIEWSKSLLDATQM